MCLLMVHNARQGPVSLAATFEQISGHIFTSDRLLKRCCGSELVKKAFGGLSVRYCHRRSFRHRKLVLASSAMRIWAVSDVHTDYKENMAW